MDVDQRQNLSKREQQIIADKIRNEGIEAPKNEDQKTTQEIDLEIEAPGSASKVAEEGSMTIQTEEDF